MWNKDRIISEFCFVFVLITFLLFLCNTPITNIQEIYEPPHDKFNKTTVHPAKTKISLGIRPFWLCAQWVAKDPSFLHADSEDSDQTGRMPRLIWVFAGRTCHFVGFVMRRLISVTSFVFPGWRFLHVKAETDSSWKWMLYPFVIEDTFKPRYIHIEVFLVRWDIWTKWLSEPNRPRRQTHGCRIRIRTAVLTH